MQEKTAIKSKRFLLVQKEKYEVDLEYNKEFAILHLPYLDKLSKTVYNDMVSSFTGLDDFLKEMGYSSLWAAIPPQDTPLGKLVSKFGFEYRGHAENYDVYERAL